jgi:hypothetical protein
MEGLGLTDSGDARLDGGTRIDGLRRLGCCMIIIIMLSIKREKDAPASAKAVACKVVE